MVLDKIGRRLHLLPSHPLCIMKRRVEDYCARYAASKGQTAFAVYDDLSPIVTSKSCFDDLLIPPEHVSRQKSDTYYITDSTVRLIAKRHSYMHICSKFYAFPFAACTLNALPRYGVCTCSCFARTRALTRWASCGRSPRAPSCAAATCTAETRSTPHTTPYSIRYT